MAENTEYIGALEREKAGYVLTDNADRIAQVDAEIARVKGAKRSSRKETVAVAPAPEKTTE